MVIILLNKCYKILITVVLFLITIISFKSNALFKEWFYKNILDKTLSFTKIASKYESLFGTPIPFKNVSLEPVFSEKLEYTSKERYKKGVLVNVSNNLIPSIGKGLVIFIGQKDGENCIIVEQEDIDVNYCMLKNIGVKLYDHVDAGTYIGEVNKKLFLYFTKDGEFLNYEDYI